MALNELAPRKEMIALVTVSNTDADLGRNGTWLMFRQWRVEDRTWVWVDVEHRGAQWTDLHVKEVRAIGIEDLPRDDQIVINAELLRSIYQDGFDAGDNVDESIADLLNEYDERRKLKIAEPTGKSAIVTDLNGEDWILVNTRGLWRSVSGGVLRMWNDIRVAEIVSEGR